MSSIRDQILAKDGLVLGAVKVWDLYRLGEEVKKQKEEEAAWKRRQQRVGRQSGRSVRPYRKGA